MTRYEEYKNKMQEEYNRLPIFYAFSNEQFEKHLAERGLKLEDAKDHVYRLGGVGGFYLKKDAEQIRAFFEVDHDEELRKMMSDDLEFAEEAFEYEMFNHEYPINWQGDYDVCGCFGSIEYSDDKYASDYLKELGFNDDMIVIYKKAARMVQNALEW